MSQGKGPSQRQLRVGEQLRHAIVETLQRGHFKDDVLIDRAPLITVTEVRASPDLKNATAYVLALGGMDIDMDAVLPALNESASQFQKEIGRSLRLKFTPRIRFILDESFEEASRIDNILNNL